MREFEQIESVEWFADLSMGGDYTIPADTCSVKLEPFKVYIGDRVLSLDESYEWFQEAIEEKAAREKLDENGLARCGCGGKAILFHLPDIEGPGSGGDRWAVFCEKTCGMETSDMTSPEYAVETWNTAMGYTAPSRPGAIVPDVREETGGKQMRMHEILGVEPGEEFCFDSEKYKYMVSDQGYLLYDKFGVGWADVMSIDRLTEIINHPDRIIRKPRLTGEQFEVLKALNVLGYKWMAKDENGLVRCGCGGKAEIVKTYDENSWTNIVHVVCKKCKIHITFTAPAELRGTDALKEDAKAAWNRAMGGSHVKK